MPRARKTLGLAVLLLPLLAGNAAAAVVSANDAAGEMYVAAKGDEVNTAKLRVDPGPGARTITFFDSGTPPFAGPGCEQVSAAAAECFLTPSEVVVDIGLAGGDDRLSAVAETSRLELRSRMGGGNDVATLSPGGVCAEGFRCVVHGGPGEDRIFGGHATDNYLGGGKGDDEISSFGFSVISPGPGDDLVNGGPEGDFVHGPDPGDDRIFGGGGDDNLDDAAGKDVIRGECGSDQIDSLVAGPRVNDVLDGGGGNDIYIRYCGRCRVSLDGEANDGARGSDEADLVIADDFEVIARNSSFDPNPRVILGDGADRLIGDNGPNKIFPTRGADVVLPLAGKDLVWSGMGPDLIRAADGERDIGIRCGPGIDRAIIDAIDRVDENCEDVEIR